MARPRRVGQAGGAQDGAVTGAARPDRGHLCPRRPVAERGEAVALSRGSGGFLVLGHRLYSLFRVRACASVACVYGIVSVNCVYILHASVVSTYVLTYLPEPD